jgi:thiol:disulfide interchange protein
VRLWLLLSLALAAPPGTGSLADRGAGTRADDEDPFSWSAEPITVAAGGEATLVLRLSVPPKHHVYRDQIDVAFPAPAPLVPGSPSYPPGQIGADPGGGETARELYDLDVLVHVPIRAPDTASGLVPLRVTVRHQGCRVGLCYPPKTEDLDVFVRVVVR